MKESLDLPKFDIPDMGQKQLTSMAFERWIIQNMELLAKSGRLGDVLNNPTRRPVNKRFVL